MIVTFTWAVSWRCNGQIFRTEGFDSLSAARTFGERIEETEGCLFVEILRKGETE